MPFFTEGEGSHCSLVELARSSSAVRNRLQLESWIKALPTAELKLFILILLFSWGFFISWISCNSILGWLVPNF